MRIQTFVWLFFVLWLVSCNGPLTQVDLIVHNATIYTVDDDFAKAQAMAIKDGRVVETGPEREILNKYTATQIVDCEKKFIYPGFIDAHCHFLGYGKTLMEADLRGCKSFDEVVERVVKFNYSNQSGWIVARGWDQNLWSSKEFPANDVLDSLFPDKPVYLKRIDGHAALANSVALRLAGIDRSTNFVGGFVESKNAKLTGILVDNAMNLVESKIPAASEEDNAKALLLAQEKCFEVGLTSVADAGLMHSDVLQIKKMQQAGELKMRMYIMLTDAPENFNYYLKSGIDTTDMLSVRAFKFYLDGALGSRGACLLQPYDDLLPAKSNGFLLQSVDSLFRKAWQLKEAGFQVCTHAIGDSANRVILKLYGQVLEGEKDHRWRVEHAQVVHAADMDYFGRYHIIPSIQPTHATSDMAWAIERLGRNRLKRAYTYRELKEQMGMCALGTDFPVEDISPLGTFYAAVVRKDFQNNPPEGFQMENALSREDALRGMTIWAAVANFEDHKKGSLEKGKFADFVLLDTDLMSAPEGQLKRAKVLSTWSAGKRLYPK